MAFIRETPEEIDLALAKRLAGIRKRRGLSQEQLSDAEYDCRHPSAAYDLTRSTTYYGEHTTTVNGNGKDPGSKELLAVGKSVGLSAKRCRQIADEIREKTASIEEKYRDIHS